MIPAALAIAEREHSSGHAFLLGVALGYEAALRIGEAVNPSHYRFWHPTGTVATFGAAAAAGSILKLSAAQMLDALGTAGTQAAGLWEFNADGAMSKHLHPGKAAFNGVLSADLAREGFTGATRILEGERGIFRAMSESADPTRITAGLGAAWKILETCYKLHSCCGHTHTAIDTALDLRRRIDGREIAAVEIQIYGPGDEIVKELNPRSPYQAKFSLAYCVAAALREGHAASDSFPRSALERTVCATLHSALCFREPRCASRTISRRNIPRLGGARFDHAERRRSAHRRGRLSAEEIPKTPFRRASWRKNSGGWSSRDLARPRRGGRSTRSTR